MMSANESTSQRTLGLFDSVGIGVGAIVGGGILALAGTALFETGAGAWLAFLLNGLIAVITALSFAELSTVFPQSGGTYLFAKRVLSVGAAFSVGWIVWFASIVAAALYAIGFAAFLLDIVTTLCGTAPVWISQAPTKAGVALVSVVVCTAFLRRSAGSGGNGINVLKVLVFAALIGGGLYAWHRDQPPAWDRLSPLLGRGSLGLFAAMGYTFIALQGFDLIAATAGKIRNPRSVLPKAMLLSLLIALTVYLPLLLLICISGIPEGSSLEAMVIASPDTIVAQAARVFLGNFGFWLVMVVGVLSMLSALLANLYAAAYIAQAMAQDRTLPRLLERVDAKRGTPFVALWATAILAVLVLLLIPDIAQAGAAASLIFLITFALAHLICLLARRRQPHHQGFRVPLWPVLPSLGLLACVILAIFQGIKVPQAGIITGAWLVGGFFCYLWLFGRRARVYDAASESTDPDLLELRGRSPLVLVPIANPANAGVMALLGTCISPPRVGRVLLLNVSSLPTDDDPNQDFQNTADVLRLSMSAAIQERIRVEGLATVAADPWNEINRVARSHRCASVLLGMASLADDEIRSRLENLASRLPGNVVIFRAPAHWHPRDVKRVLVPIGGRVVHNALRARLLNGLRRRVEDEFLIEYLLVLPTTTKDRDRRRSEELWTQWVTDETAARSEVRVVLSDEVPEAILEAAQAVDLVVLGLNKTNPKRPMFGQLTTRVVQETSKAVMVIGQRG